MRISVIVPVYNEAQTIKQVLTKLLKTAAVGEIIVVNDGSSDGTKSILDKIKSPKLHVFHKVNGGKGSAVRLGLSKAKYEYCLIQDADLEYDPADIAGLLAPIIHGRVQVVYGSRFLGPHSNLLYWHRKGNEFLNFLVNFLYDTTLSDMETCYKVAPTKLLQSLNLKSNAFDIEPEITCKILKKGIPIFEVPISYVGRDFSQGKKITWRDGLTALAVILRERFS